MTDPSKYYIFYDGECGFCNHWVHWILKKDTKDLFLFASLQSDFGQNFLTERGLQRKNFNTLYLWKPNSFYLTKSAAAEKIAQLLGGKHALLAKMNFLPVSIGDKIYDFIAERRERLSDGKCFVPTEKERKKFV